jgi:hypothetical protein
MQHYTFDELACRLIDLLDYAHHFDAIGLLEKVISWASRTMDHENVPSSPTRIHSGRP